MPCSHSADCVRLGRYGQEKQVEIGTVSLARSAVGTTVALEYEGNPTISQGKLNISTKIGKNDGRMEEERSTHKEILPVVIDVT